MKRKTLLIVALLLPVAGAIMFFACATPRFQRACDMMG